MGLSVGPTLTTGYILAVGTGFHFGYLTFSLSLIAILIGTLVGYFVEVSSGYRADKYGEKLTLFSGLLLKAFCFIFYVIGVSLILPSPLLFILLVLLSTTTFGIAHSLVSGNFEDWLQKQCNENNSLNVFSMNMAYYYIGLLSGVSLIFVFEPPVQYEYMSQFAILVYGFSAVMGIIAAILVLVMKQTKPFEISKLLPLLKSFSRFNTVTSSEISSKATQAESDLKQNSFLNKLLWVHSSVFSIFITVECLIPIYLFVADRFNMQQKFIILVFCYFAPTMIGSLLKSRQQKSASGYSLASLSTETYLFFFIAIGITFTLYIPIDISIAWYADPMFLSFASIVALFQIFYGRLAPQYFEVSSRMAQESSELPKTVLSIGERRKRVGGIITMLAASFAGFFGVNEAYFIIVAFTAILCLFYAHHVFRSHQLQIANSVR